MADIEQNPLEWSEHFGISVAETQEAIYTIDRSGEYPNLTVDFRNGLDPKEIAHLIEGYIINRETNWRIKPEDI
jgi:hypothetical protein